MCTISFNLERSLDFLFHKGSFRKMYLSSSSDFLTHFLLVTGLLVCLKSTPTKGIHIDLSDQHKQGDIDQNSSSDSFPPTTEPYILGSTTGQAATMKPGEHRTYEAMIDHLKQLERAPEAFASVMERLRDALKRFVDRIKPKGQQISQDISQESGGIREKKSFLPTAAVDEDNQVSCSSATMTNARNELDTSKVKVENEEEKEV